MRPSSLPQSIPPPESTFAAMGVDGRITIDVNWYLFLYNLASQVLLPGATPLSSDTVIAMVEADSAGMDWTASQRLALNALLQQPDMDAGPTLRDMANANLLALDASLPDATPRAQPAAAVTLTGSPFAYTALSDGVLCISGGTVSAVSISRQGTAVATGSTAGVFPVKRLDIVGITYIVAPTVNFLPS